MIKLFNRWETDKIKVEDPGLRPYINLKPIIVPKTGGRNAKYMFYKSKDHIVERLIRRLMVPGHRGKKHTLTSGHCCGKMLHKYKVVEKTFLIIEEKTKKNPIEVFVRAIENAAPRDEITTIQYLSLIHI